MKLVTKKLRLQFNADRSKLIDKQSTSGEKWWSTSTGKLLVDRKKIGSDIEEITNKTIISNFLKLVEETLEEINFVISTNKKWLTIDKTWKIPIPDGYIIKDPLPEEEIDSVKNLIAKQEEIRDQYKNALTQIKNSI